MKLRPEVTTHAILLNHAGDMMLLIKWRDDAGNVVWSFPGGHVELGETVRDALLREVKEETGYDAEIIGFLGIYDNIVTRGEACSHYVNIIWIAIVRGGEPSTDEDEVLDMMWVDVNDVQSHGLTQNAAKILSDFRERRLA